MVFLKEKREALEDIACHQKPLRSFFKIDLENADLNALEKMNFCALIYGKLICECMSVLVR